MGLLDSIPLAICSSSLSVSVKTVAHWSEYNLLQETDIWFADIIFCERAPYRIVTQRIKCFCKVDRGGPHVDAPYPVLFDKAVCMSSNGLWSGTFVEALQDLENQIYQACCKACCDEAPRTLCTTSTVCKMDGNFPVLSHQLR